MRIVKDTILKAEAFFCDNFRDLGSQVFIPRYGQNVGGPQTFLFNFVKGLKAEGVSVTRNRFREFDTVFFPIEWDYTLLDQYKRRNKRIVQRLDGLEYNHHSGEEYLDTNRNCRRIYERIVNHVVFQSEYSRKQVLYFWGKEILPPEQSIIVNGANLELFHPDFNLNVERPDKWIFVTSGNFRHRSMIEPIIIALDRFYQKTQKMEWKIIGPVCSELNHFLTRPYINYLGPMSVPQVAKELRFAHLFLFSFLNPNCPNSIIEAISSGLPVVSYDSGAIGELCHFNHELIAETPNSLIHTEGDLVGDLLLSKIERAVDEYEKYVVLSNKHSNDYGLANMVKKYHSILF